LVVFPITTGTTPHPFQTCINQQERVLGKISMTIDVPVEDEQAWIEALLGLGVSGALEVLADPELTVPRTTSVQRVADAIADASPVLSRMPIMTLSGKRTIDVADNDEERAAAMFKRAYWMKLPQAADALAADGRLDRERGHAIIDALITASRNGTFCAFGGYFLVSARVPAVTDPRT
jgi:hypothetical protein